MPDIQYSSTYTPGTYTATGTGRNGDVTVTMTFDEESITEITMDISGETQEVVGDAAEKLTQAIFEQQSAEYKESILPKKVRARVAVEALSDFGWGKYVGLDGATVSMEGFGASAPAGVLFEKFGFTVDHVAEVVRKVVADIK